MVVNEGSLALAFAAPAARIRLRIGKHGMPSHTRGPSDLDE